MKQNLLQDHIDGYFDGRDPDSPVPGDNRSYTYRHSFMIGRREIEGNHLEADEARILAKEANAKDGLGTD